jgi:hypothetical protein
MLPSEGRQRRIYKKRKTKKTPKTIKEKKIKVPVFANLENFAYCTCARCVQN